MAVLVGQDGAARHVFYFKRPAHRLPRRGDDGPEEALLRLMGIQATVDDEGREP